MYKTWCIYPSECLVSWNQCCTRYCRVLKHSAVLNSEQGGYNLIHKDAYPVHSHNIIQSNPHADSYRLLGSEEQLDVGNLPSFKALCHRHDSCISHGIITVLSAVLNHQVCGTAYPAQQIDSQGRFSTRPRKDKDEAEHRLCPSSSS